MKFSKAKMLERIHREGLDHLVTKTELLMMDNLDGQPANPVCWARVVQDAPVYWVVGKDGNGSYVRDCDCI